ncbi:MAG: hypothetical protein JO119_00980 [Acidobacteria bacterium]|nr:hypothetical protein [Acidobacteriota bacterium]
MLKSIVVPGVHAIPAKPAAKREGAFRIFAAPIFFFAVAMLLAGGYIVEDQLTSPAASQSYALFAGAFFMATSITLLVELFHIANRHRKDMLDLRSHVARTDWRKTDVARASRSAARGVSHRARLPYQRCYIYRVRVRA